MKLLLGDCLDKLKELDDNSVDSIVTDPPYGLSAAKNSGRSSKGGFMGKEWDYDVPSVDIWEECMRVLKPGGHLLAFAGSRTYHRMAVRIEDAGFEIRDQLMWIYGSGFPKSMNIGIQVDKKQGNVGKVIGEKKLWGANASGGRGNQNKNGYQPTKIGSVKYEEIREVCNEWEGWGTALKPAHEPIVMARKPLSEKTVVDNVLEWGTGGINIDASRIELSEGDDPRLGGKGSWSSDKVGKNVYGGAWAGKEISSSELGRFPANVIFDEEAGKILDEQSGTSKSSSHISLIEQHTSPIYGKYDKSIRQSAYDDTGGASRFFYCPKTSKTDRNEGLDHLEDKYYAAGNQAKAELKRGNVEFNANKGKGRDERHNHNQVGVSKNNHPTVKPTDLMLYLIRLVTPKGGTTLDPFMGSGSTGKAAVRGGFDFVGIEREEEYMKIAKARIQYEQDNPYNEETGERVKINKQSNKFFSF